MQKISPFLWFDNEAEEAASYVSIFKNSEILNVSRHGEGAPRPAASAMSVSFVLDGLELQALNGGPGSSRALQAMLKMTKIDIAALRAAYDGT